MKHLIAWVVYMFGLFTTEFALQHFYHMEISLSLILICAVALCAGMIGGMIQFS